jgi:hypothetical protein
MPTSHIAIRQTIFNTKVSKLIYFPALIMPNNESGDSFICELQLLPPIMLTEIMLKVALTTHIIQIYCNYCNNDNTLFYEG